MKRALLFLTLFVFSLFNNTQAQDLEHEAPTLQVGLSGLSFSRGTLDAQLIMEIVAEKQEEVKLKIVQNMFMEKMKSTGGTFYSFTDNVVKNIIQEHDPTIRTKKILENAVNMVFVVTYLDYYLRTLNDNALKDSLDSILINYDFYNPDYSEGLIGLWNAPAPQKETPDYNITINNVTPANADETLFANEGANAGKTAGGIAAKAQSVNADILKCAGKKAGRLAAKYNRKKLKRSAAKKLGTEAAQAALADAGNITTIENNSKLIGEKAGEEVGKHKGILAGNKAKNAVLSSPEGKPEIATAVGKAAANIAGTDAGTSEGIKVGNYMGKKLAYEIGYEAAKRAILARENRQYKPNTTKREQVKDIDKRVKGLALLVDMSSEVIKKNQRLEELGLMQTSYSAVYEHLNEYINPDTPHPPKVDKVYDDMYKKLDTITQYIGLVSYIVDKYTYRYDQKVFLREKRGQILTTLKDASLLLELENAALRLDTAITALTQNPHVEFKEAIGKFTKVRDYIRKAKNALEKLDSTPNLEDAAIIADVIYTLYKDLTPILADEAWLNEKIAPAITQLNDITRDISQKLIADHPQLQKLDEIYPFIKLAGQLYQFKDANTFSDYLAFITMLEDVFPDDSQIKDAVSTLVSFIKDYTVIETNQKNEEYISFNVESFIVKLQSIKPNRARHLGFQFTVGVNQVFFNKDVTITTSDGSLDNIRNFSYVGEKIGIKYKLWDWSFWQTRNPGETYKKRKNGTWWVKKSPPKEPVVSNLFLNLYGSGILYNLVNTSTNNEFKLPQIGAGLGLTFFNGLDLTFSLGVPIFDDKPFLPSNKREDITYSNGVTKSFKKTDSFDYAYFNLGFDIQFGEYLDRLNKNRKQAKTQKQLAKAVAAQEKSNNKQNAN